MINRVVVVGRLTSQPELRHTQDGTAVLNFGLAVERSYRQKDGEKAVDFFTVIAWRKLAEICAEYCGKGKMVAVDGTLQSRKYEKNGVQFTYVEIAAESVQFLTPKKPHDDADSFGEIPM